METLILVDHGDPSVGIFRNTFTVSGDFDGLDQETRAEFYEGIKDAFEVITGNRVEIFTKKEYALDGVCDPS